MDGLGQPGGAAEVWPGLPSYPARGTQRTLPISGVGIPAGGQELCSMGSCGLVYGNKGLVVQLEDMVRDESNPSEDTKQILRDWLF